MKSILFILTCTIIACCCNCQMKSQQDTALSDIDSANSYTNPLLQRGTEPWVIYHDSFYYYTQSTENEISLWKTSDLTQLRTAMHKIIYDPKGQVGHAHIWAPELHFIQGKWFLYYTADDGNTDNHQLYVAVNDSTDPMKGAFIYKGHIVTDKQKSWAIHPNTFFIDDKQYLIWSGWQTKRADEETQCIYIASMENPWTLSSDRILISIPTYEWERQWICPDGSQSAYPIYVNENPQAFITPTKVNIYYSASGLWTPYYCIGKLEANIDSDLLDPHSWKKYSEPVFMHNAKDSIFSPGGSVFFYSPKRSNWYMIYHARNKPNDAPGEIDSRSPRLQPIQQSPNGDLILGKPIRIDSLLPCP